MPFVENPIFCSSCQGTGKIRPICAFNVHEKVMLADCLNCRGVGTIMNKVYVNPFPGSKPEPISGAAPVISPEEINLHVETEKVFEEISKIKYSKKSKLHTDILK